MPAHLTTVLASALLFARATSPQPTLPAPTLVDRTTDSLTVGWSFPDGPTVLAFVLSQGGRDMWTGTATSHAVRNLVADTCYSFTVRASTSAGWTDASPALRVATRSGAVPNVAQVSAALSALRSRLLRDALADAAPDPCALSSYSKPEYLGGVRVRGLRFRAQLGYTAHLAPALTAVNCALARCSSQATETARWGAGLVGRLTTEKPGSGGARVPVTVHLHGDRPAMTFSDPAGGARARMLLPLTGCRAGVSAGGTCFAVSCAAEAESRTFCVPSANSPTSEAGAAAVQTARQWVALVNRAAHGLHAPRRYEAEALVAPTAPLADDERRDRAHGVLELPAVRAAWTASFLTALPALGICPHFPRVVDAFACRRLLPRFQDALPPLSAGRSTLDVAAAALADGAGSASAAAWVATIAGTTHTDLGAVLRALGPGALSPRFLVGVLAQAVYALGVARHALGLHHNGLLDQGAVRLVQTPRESPAHRQFTCYRVSAGALRGDPLAPLRGRAGSRPPLPSDFETLLAVAGPVASTTEDACAAGAACDAEASRAGRAGWCVDADSVDGFSIELGDLGSATLTRVQLGWWARGYAFPNTPWRDDLRDLSLSLCAFAEAGVAGGYAAAADGHLESLCAAMRGGAYAANPLAALLHPLFSGARDGGGGNGSAPWPGLDRTCDVEASRRRVFAYSPATRARRPSPLWLPPLGPASMPSNVSSVRSQLLSFLAPPRPSVWSAGWTDGVTVGWSPHPASMTSPQPDPTAFNLLVDGTSVYSGPARSFSFRLLVRGGSVAPDGPAPALQAAGLPPPLTDSRAPACRRLQVTAFYASLGWTALSQPTLVSLVPGAACG